MTFTSSADFIGYLKPNVIAEPLISQWYAWSYLIPPATAARYLTESQLKVMQSFVAAPEVHVSALRDPAMQGGPFINHSADRAGEVKALMEKTKAEQTRLMGLSSAIATLTNRLADHPPGQSLEPVYAQIPEALRGYVELVYDDNHCPAIRFMEGLLYRSEYYDTRRQSIALRVYEDIDQRAFVMSTPRLPDENSLFLSIPFIDARLDDLFRMRHTPASVQAMAERLEIPESSREFFFSLFTPSATSKPEPYQGDGIRIRYLGHACVLIETAEVSILCDPLVSNEHPTGMARYSYADLPETIDYAVITHNHQDHVMLETLLQLRHKIGQVVIPTGQKGSLLDPSLKLALQQIGFANVCTLEEMESIPLPGGELVSIPVLGEHGDLNIATKNAYWVNLKGRSILCAADSNNLDPSLYKNIHHLLGELDVLFIGMECDGAPFTWAYGPILSQSVSRQQAQTRRLDGSNADRGTALVDQLNPKQVYVYAMGQEPWLLYITSISYTPESDPIQQSNRLVARCQQQNRISERVLGKKEIELAPHPAANLVSEKVARVIPVSDSLAITGLDAKAHGRSRVAIPAPQITTVPPEKSNQLTQLLEHLQSLDVRLRVDGDTLHCNAPKGILTPALLAKIEAQKSYIVALTKGETIAPTYDDAPPPAPPPDDLTQLLEQLQSLDVRLWLDGDALRCNAPKGALTPELTAQLKERKPAIIALLQGRPAEPAAESLAEPTPPAEPTQPAEEPVDEPADALTPLLERLQSRDVRLWLDGDTLRCNAPKGALTPELTAQLKEHKPAIIALLKGSAAPSAPQPAAPKTAQAATQTAEPQPSQPDWQQDIVLPANISPPHPPISPSPHPQNILLTGATGFLGAFLLRELLQQTDATIHCLLRTPSPAAGLSRLEQCLTDYKIWQPGYASRLVAIPGDLAKPGLGLTEAQFSALAEQIDSIYHNGAQVHHISPYAQLRASNVFGTREMIRLACQGRTKPLHYTSTLSVLPPQALPGRTEICEQDNLRDYPVPVGGYNRSKWVAEQLVAQARDRRLPVTIYRPGPISGDSQTGVFNRSDFLYRLMQGYVQSGLAPDGEMPLDMLPVDYVGKAMVYLSLQPESMGQAFHLVHPQPASSNVMFEACQAAGYAVKRVPYETWFEKLMHIAQGDQGHALYPLVSLFSSRQTGQSDTPQQTLDIPFDTQQTDTGLKDAPFDLPRLNRPLFDIYLRAMVETGTLSPPPVSSPPVWQ